MLPEPETFWWEDVTLDLNVFEDGTTAIVAELINRFDAPALVLPLESPVWQKGDRVSLTVTVTKHLSRVREKESE
jgi:hypothetical protein